MISTSNINIKIFKLISYNLPLDEGGGFCFIDYQRQQLPKHFPLILYSNNCAIATKLDHLNFQLCLVSCLNSLWMSFRNVKVAISLSLHI
uniref:Uncharacterized protein n=1 Tax=Octopus bimaculoides TaxID=37653 RepID=A0A0L8HHE6_OCTBM